MSIELRELKECDLEQADHIFRLAFGTFLGLPQPLDFAAGAQIIQTRWKARDHNTFIGAYDGNVLVGSNVMTRWGSFGIFGPLTVHPTYWDKGIGRQLLSRTMDVFKQWGVDVAGLFTFPHSTKHVALYQKFDFWPQQLSMVLAKSCPAHTPATSRPEISAQAVLEGARAVADATFSGLDLTDEILSVTSNGLGEVVTVSEGGRITAFAICHIGEGTEAGPGTILVRFAAALPGEVEAFGQLLDACGQLGSRHGASTLVAGINTGCALAYRAAMDRGFRIEMTGVVMQSANNAGFLTGNRLVIGDWR